MPTNPGPTAAPTAPPAGLRAYLGLALLGWGAAILLGVTPHEDLVVGAGLAVFGAGLVATAPAFPRLRPGQAAAMALAGVAGAAAVAADLLAGSPLDPRKLAALLLGCALAAALPWLRRPVRLPRRTATDVGSLAGCAIVVVGAPLAVWGLQAGFTGHVGVTPVEAFVRVGLIQPLHAILALLGLPAAVDGQTVTYATRQGELAVDVGAACSGIQAMALFGGVLALYLVAERPGGRRMAQWCCIGLAGVYAANLLRLVVIFLVGYAWGPDALVQVHAQAGWVFFVGWTLLFARIVPRSRGPPRRVRADASP